MVSGLEERQHQMITNQIKTNEAYIEILREISKSLQEISDATGKIYDMLHKKEYGEYPE